MPNRLVPTPDADSLPFWEACRDHRLTFQKCSDCGDVRWPPAFLCHECHSRDAEWIESGGRAKIYSYVVYHQAFHPSFKGRLPYVVAVVELDEGPMMLTNIVGCAPDSLSCDMPVQLVWDDVSDDFCLPQFTPIQG